MWAHRVTLTTAVTTFFLLLVGGLVHGTGASLACPDWPTCYGTLMPPMRGLIFYEHGHRLLATAVGILTIVSAVLIYREHRDRPLLWKLAFGALGLVIFQGLLGGLTVIFKLPPAVSTAHLGTSMIFFSTMIVLAFLTRPDAAPAQTPVPDSIPRVIVLSGVIVYLQIVMGAVVRHTNSGLACLSFPFCGLTAWPAAAVWIQMTHRTGAALVFVTVTRLSRSVSKTAGAPAAVRWLARSAVVLMLVQIALGVMSVFSHLELITVTAHLGVGALLLAAHVSMWMIVRGSTTAPSTADSGPVLTKGVRPSTAQ